MLIRFLESNNTPVSSWSKWGPCLERLDGEYQRIRQRFCSHEDVSKCWTDVQKRVKTEKEKCDKALNDGVYFACLYFIRN